MVKAPQPASLSVLVVDDVRDVRVSYRYLLELQGFRVILAADPHEALGAIRNEKIDIVLIDLYIPGPMDGLGLIDFIRRQFLHPPVLIAMSGDPHVAYRSSLQAARYAGADATLMKPIAPAELVSTILLLVAAIRV